MRYVATLAMLGALVGPAAAQFGGVGGAPTPGNPADKEVTARAKKEQERVEKEYDETMKRLPSRAPRKTDPWQSVRPANEPKR